MNRLLRNRREVALFGIGLALGVNLGGAMHATHFVVGAGVAVASVLWTAAALALVAPRTPSPP